MTTLQQLMIRALSAIAARAVAVQGRGFRAYGRCVRIALSILESWDSDRIAFSRQRLLRELASLT